MQAPQTIISTVHQPAQSVNTPIIDHPPIDLNDHAGPPNRHRPLQPIRRFVAWLNNCVVPPVCMVCHSRIDAHDALCTDCWNGIAFIQRPVCDRLGIPLPFDVGPKAISAAALANPPDFDRARSVAHYGGTMRRLIHDKKYRDRHEGRRLLARLLASAGQEITTETDIVIPVPLAWSRLLSRRYNQSAELARLLSAATHLPYEPQLLYRRRRTRPQVGLTQTQRRENVSGAFAVTTRGKLRLKGQRVLLIDDVLTSGATVNACARALKRSGAASVDVLTLAIATGHAVAPA
jgi:ComF family protein